MFDFFEKRTGEHIKRVEDNINVILKNVDNVDKDKLIIRGKNHDKSKYSKIEYIPYVWLTWWYKEKQEGNKFTYPSNDIKNDIKIAGDHHVKINKHHPESHDNINDMNDIDICEMVADWAAMSQELNDNLKN